MTAIDAPAYPERWEWDVVLRDGGTVHVRPIRPTDGPAIEALHGRLSAETIYFRFFSPVTTLSPQMLERFVNVDYVDRLALVALLGDDIIAVGRYEHLPSRAGEGGEAEVAFLVDDAHQGRGLGTVLLEHLVTFARAAGISRFVADTLPGNSRMLRVFHKAGFDDERTFADGVIRVAFPIVATEASLALAHDRERAATARSVRRLLAPRSVAVIGASRREGTLGHQLVRNLLSGGFDGPVYPVNPEAEHVCSVRAYRSVLDIPDTVELAVVAVRADAVPGVVEQCVRKHVGGLVVISSGFADRDDAGREAERRLVTEARRNGMRLVGPNCMGVLNTDPGVRLAATFAAMPPAGGIGFIAQSGALGVVLLDELNRRGLGVSTFVSTGNKADISGNDLLQYWDGDGRTTVVCMYIETFGNPRTFARIARRVARNKPVVAVKSGDPTPAPGDPTPATGPAGDDRAVAALFRQTGVIRTETLEELLDVAQVLASQPLPAGRRVAIIGSGGGPGALAAGAARAAGLEVVELSARTQQQLRSVLPDPSQVANPVDLPPDATPATLGRALAVALADDGVDAGIALYTSLLAAPIGDVAGAIATARQAAPAKPVVGSLLGRRGRLAGGVPSFAFPESAARALGRVTDYALWRRRPAGTLPDLTVDAAAAQAVVEAALASSARTWLDRPAVAAVAAAYGIGLLPSRRVTGADDAVGAAEALCYPVVALVDPGSALTKPDRQSIRLWLPEAQAVRLAWAELAPRGPVLIQASAPPGWDIAVGVAQDPELGPLVTLGACGRLGEPVRTRASRILPLTDIDAAELRSEVLGLHRPDGRPWSAGETTAVEGLLLRVGRLVEDRPEVTHLDLEPVVVGAGAAAVAGMRLCVQRPTPHPELAVRRLR